MNQASSEYTPADDLFANVVNLEQAYFEKGFGEAHKDVDAAPEGYTDARETGYGIILFRNDLTFNDFVLIVSQKATSWALNWYSCLKSLPPCVPKLVVPIST